MRRIGRAEDSGRLILAPGSFGMIPRKYYVICLCRLAHAFRIVREEVLRSCCGADSVALDVFDGDLAPRLPFAASRSFLTVSDSTVASLLLCSAAQRHCRSTPPEGARATLPAERKIVSPEVWPNPAHVRPQGHTPPRGDALFLNQSYRPSRMVLLMVKTAPLLTSRPLLAKLLLSHWPPLYRHQAVEPPH